MQDAFCPRKKDYDEGQRKALFEDCEDEKKINADEILNLKKLTAQLTFSLHENANTSASYRLRRLTKILEKLVGPLDYKTCDEVEQLLDLLIIDKTKQLDLLKYDLKMRQKKLSEIGQHYQSLNTKVDKKFLTAKVDLPVKKSTCELQNSIHAIEVQIREAVHVKDKYTDIRRALKDDSFRFESNIHKLNEEIEGQKRDIQKLQTILHEAIKMKTLARTKLLEEEKVTTSCADSREKDLNEGRKLLTYKKQELEKLEKKIFQDGKILARPEPEGAEDGQNDEDRPETPEHPCEALAAAFEILKTATGGTSIEEVLARFKSQKETQEKLITLRKKSENDKRRIERRNDLLEKQLEAFRYSEVKDAERQTNKMDELSEAIQDELAKEDEFKNLILKKEDGLKVVICGLRAMYLCVKPAKAPREDEDPLVMVEKIQGHLAGLLQKLEKSDISLAVDKSDNDMEDEKWLPAPYMSLVRKTPVPQQGASPAPPPPPGSEEEEEVPSRGYLKRQAQLVVDTKTRRKTLRVQVGKR